MELKYGDVNYQRINPEASGRCYKYFVLMELLWLLKECVNITSQMVYPRRKVFAFLLSLVLRDDKDCGYWLAKKL